MTKTSFLARTTWGQPRYLLVAMACMFVLALIPMGLRRAMQAANIGAANVLSAEHPASQDLAWVRDHFPTDAEILVSWDGCTLGTAEPLALLAKKLQSKSAGGSRYYANAVSGPQALKQLMESQPGLSYADAIARLEGALIGPQESDSLGRSLGHAGRATCLRVVLAAATMNDPARRQAAVDAIPAIAAEQCGIDPATVHMIGAPVQQAAASDSLPSVTIRMAALVGLWSAALTYWRLRSARLTALVVGVAGASALLAMALPSYAAIFQVLWNGSATSAAGMVSPQLWALPVVVYILALAGATQLMVAYAHACRVAAHDRDPASAEHAATMAWRPVAIAALVAAGVFVVLVDCEVAPLRHFGPYAALGVVASLALLFGIAPVVLHRYPLDRSRLNAIESGKPLPGVSRLAVDHSWPLLGAALFSLLIMGWGVTRLQAELEPGDIAGLGSPVVRDFKWFERNIGTGVPLDVILAIPSERLRSAAERPELDGQQYRLTVADQITLVDDVTRRLAACPQLNGLMTATTFAPQVKTPVATTSALSGDAETPRPALDHLFSREFLQSEHNPAGGRPTGRELWRLNARVASRSPEGEAVDFGLVLADVDRAVAPLLWSYQQRDRIVQILHEEGKQLSGARVCVLFRAPGGAAKPAASTQEHVLGELLAKSGTAPDGVSYFNLASYERPGSGDARGDDAYRRTALASLRKQDIIVLASASSDLTARKIADTGILMADVAGLPPAAETSSPALADGGGPRPIVATYAGTGVVAERAEDLLGAGLPGLLGMAVGLTAVILVGCSLNAPAGILLTVVAAAPATVVLGAWGWLGWKVDLGAAMALGSVAGLSVASMLQVVRWYQDGMQNSNDRKAVVLRAIGMSQPAIVATLIIAGLGAGPLAFSSSGAIRAAAIFVTSSAVASALVSLTLLPAMLASPLGWFLAPAEVRQLDPLWPRVQALIAQWRQPPASDDEAELIPLPQAPKGPHFGDAPSGSPVPVRRAVLASGDERREIAEGPHAALHAKLQGLRRSRPGDSPAS